MPTSPREGREGPSATPAAGACSKNYHRLRHERHAGRRLWCGCGDPVAGELTTRASRTSRWQGCTGTKANVSNVRAYGTDAAPKLYDAQGYPNEGWEDRPRHRDGGRHGPRIEHPGCTQGHAQGGVLATYQRIVNENRASVVSISWGRCEASTSDSAINLVLQQAAAQGQSVVAASGDLGASGCYNSNGSLATVTDNPASLPYATGVGGTSHTGISQFPYESVWTCGASGGGVSKWWRLDTPSTRPVRCTRPIRRGLQRRSRSELPSGAGRGRAGRPEHRVLRHRRPRRRGLEHLGRHQPAAPIWGGTRSPTPTSRPSARPTVRSAT